MFHKIHSKNQRSKQFLHKTRVWGTAVRPPLADVDVAALFISQQLKQTWQHRQLMKPQQKKWSEVTNVSSLKNDHNSILNCVGDDVQQTAAQDRMSVTMIRKWHHFYSTKNANVMQTRFLMTKQFKYILTYNGGVTGILWWHLISVHYLSKCIFCWWGFRLLFFLHVGSSVADP